MARKPLRLAFRNCIVWPVSPYSFDTLYHSLKHFFFGIWGFRIQDLWRIVSLGPGTDYDPLGRVIIFHNFVLQNFVQGEKEMLMVLF